MSNSGMPLNLDHGSFKVIDNGTIMYGFLLVNIVSRALSCPICEIFDIEEYLRTNMILG